MMIEKETCNQENMLKWIKALESGTREQCTGALTRVAPDGSTAHCCLGVATEVAMANGVALRVEDAPRLPSVTSPRYYWSEKPGPFGGQVKDGAMLPKVVQSWLGLDPDNAAVELPLEGEEVTSAVDANDNKGWTFPQIAAALRQQYITD